MDSGFFIWTMMNGSLTFRILLYFLRARNTKSLRQQVISKEIIWIWKETSIQIRESEEWHALLRNFTLRARYMNF